MEGTIWGSMEGGALRRWDEGLAELAPPFDSANPAKLSAIAQARSVRAGLALTRETPAHRRAGSAPPVHLFRGPRSQKSRIQRAFAVAACR
jgi:hypothetical protein